LFLRSRPLPSRKLASNWIAQHQVICLCLYSCREPSQAIKHEVNGVPMDGYSDCYSTKRIQWMVGNFRLRRHNNHWMWGYSMPRSSLGNKYNSHSHAKNKNLIKNKIEEHKLEKVDITTYYCHRVTSVGRI
jgi:hypothetical protein